jgi:hypothetical protein
MAMTAQEYLDTFNTLINQGNYDDAARVVKEADLAGYGDECVQSSGCCLRKLRLASRQKSDFISA